MYVRHIQETDIEIHHFIVYDRYRRSVVDFENLLCKRVLSRYTVQELVHYNTNSDIRYDSFKFRQCVFQQHEH